MRSPKTYKTKPYQKPKQLNPPSVTPDFKGQEESKNPGIKTRRIPWGWIIVAGAVAAAFTILGIKKVRPAPPKAKDKI